MWKSRLKRQQKLFTPTKQVNLNLQPVDELEFNPKILAESRERKRRAKLKEKRAKFQSKREGMKKPGQGVLNIIPDDDDKWKSVLKVFYSDDKIKDMYYELEKECKDWATLEKVNQGDWSDIDTIKGRLWQIQLAINDDDIDLTKQFIKLYELTDGDFDIEKIGDELHEALKWREDNE